MSKTEQVVCDGPECGRDISDTGNCADYRITLGNQSIPNNSGVATAMHIEPPISGGEKHFCGIKCLRAWVLKSTFT